MNFLRVQPLNRQTLSGVDALRGIAAIFVVCFHAAHHVDLVYDKPQIMTYFQAGHAGVDLFFPISGFIILFVHGKDIGSPMRLGHYLVRRFIRVIPLYWIALTLTMVLSAAGNHGLPFAFDIIWSILLLPSDNEPVLRIAWTLTYEVIFYFLFSILILNRMAGIFLFTLWAIWITLATFNIFGLQGSSSLSGFFSYEFFMGMVAAYLLQTFRIRMPWLIAVAGAVVFAIAFAAETSGTLYGFGPVARFAYGVPAAMLILGLSAMEQNRTFTIPRWMRELGAASYSIYLFHLILIGVVWQFVQRIGVMDVLSPFSLFLALSSGAVLGGVAISKLIEKPMLTLMRRHQRVPSP